MKFMLLLLLVLSFSLLLPSTLLADFVLTGTITAESGAGSGLGDWMYTLHVVWDTGTPYGLSHLDLIVDDGSNCGCNALENAIAFGDPPGYMVGEDGICEMGLDTEFVCQGDPSIDVEHPLFKFEPIEGPDCHAGPVGEMTIIFYSDYPPAPIADPNLFLVDKYAQYSGFGMVSGVFPALPCNPISTKILPWGGLKSVYR